MDAEERERRYQSRRAAHLSRLTEHGIPPETAEKAVADWEREAEAEGRDRDSAAFWDGAELWIVEHRAH
jgi:hypothetical protein